VLYNSADLSVVASEQESLCFTILESLACGTPVVSTRVGIAPYVNHDGRSGFLFERRTVEELVRGIEAGLKLPVEIRAECVGFTHSLSQSSGSICDLILDLGRRG
jgi:glycosyltransferase involved in cell wall biosynthesis